MKGEIRLGKISSIDYAKGMAKVVYHEKNAPPEGGANLYRKDLGKNPGDAMIRYDGSALTIKCTGAINIEAGGAITINGATIDLN